MKIIFMEQGQLTMVNSAELVVWADGDLLKFQANGSGTTTVKMRSHSVANDAVEEIFMSNAVDLRSFQGEVAS